MIRTVGIHRRSFGIHNPQKVLAEYEGDRTQYIQVLSLLTEILATLILLASPEVR